MEVEKIKIDDIYGYERNAKLHPQEQINQIIKSIKEFGFNDPIAIDENNMIIEGHGRYDEVVKIAKEYIDSIGGFEKFAEWGLII